MKTRKSTAGLILIGAVILLLAACGSKTSGLGDLPVFPGSTELKADDSRIAETLAKNNERDAAMRNAMGAGGQTEQRGFSLPAETTWDKVKSYYETELKSRGWTSGLGGIAGGIVDINAMMNTANKSNDLFQTTIWSKGNQTLTIILTISPTDASQKTLIQSLSTR
jgi:hypothetical protein